MLDVRGLCSTNIPSLRGYFLILNNIAFSGKGKYLWRNRQEVPEEEYNFLQETTDSVSCRRDMFLDTQYLELVQALFGWECCTFLSICGGQ